MASDALRNHIVRNFPPAAAKELNGVIEAVDNLTAPEIAFIDGVTAGLAAAGKAIVLGTSGQFITGTYSSAAENAIAISGDNNRPFTFASDDAGVALTGDCRALLSRVLLTKSTGATVNAVRGQIKMLTTIGTTGGVLAPVRGYLELDGVGNRSFTGHVACVRAALEEGATGTTTVAASSYLSGFEATLNTTRTFTETGTMSAFTANISGGTTKWPKAFYADAAGCTMGVYVGEHGSTAGLGLDIGASTALNRFHGDDGDAALTGNRRNVLSRLAVIANHTGALSLASICAQTKLVSNIDFDGDYICGLYGYLEMAGTNNLGLNSARHAACAVRARTEVGGSMEIETAGSFLAGVFAELNTTGAYTITQTGVLAAFVAAATDQRGDMWGSALYIDGADNALGFSSATDYENGIKASAAEPAGNTTHAIRVDIGGTPGYIPVYAAESF